MESTRSSSRLGAGSSPHWSPQKAATRRKSLSPIESTILIRGDNGGHQKAETKAPRWPRAARQGSGSGSAHTHDFKHDYGEDRFVHDTRAAGVRRAAAGVLAPAPAVPGSALLALVALSDATEAAAATAAGRRRNKVVALLVVLVVSTDRGFFLSTVYGKQGPAYSLRLLQA
eukprot:scaffold39091_cov60-Phaeocystis_antarctica.AAC.2